MTGKSWIQWPATAIVCLLTGVLFTSATRADAQPLPTPGQLDMSFNPGPLTVYGAVGNGMFLYAVAAQPDGKIIVGGDFDEVNFSDRPVIARFNADGSLDSGFNTPIGLDPTGTFYSAVYDIVLQADGRILVAGEFQLNGARKYLVRLNPDGSLDGSFNVNADRLIYRVVLQPDGRIIVGSNSLGTIDGVAVNHLARLNPNGSLESPLGVIAGAGSVFAIVLQPDGKIIFGGSFYMMRINPDGTYDPTFTPPNVGLSTVYAIALQRDGRVLYGGSHTYSGGDPFLFRANANGTADGTFNPVVEFGSVVWTIVVEADGKILIGGEFGRVNGVDRGNYARLHPNGTLDSFLPEPYDGVDWNVEDIAIEPSGHVVIAGSFEYFYDTVLPREYRTGLARLFDTKYRLSSTPDGTGAIVVDDDLDVYVNGIPIYTDGTAPAGSRPPIRFSAVPGDQIRLVVRDTYGHCASLTPVYLTDPFGSSTLLDPGFSLGCDRPIPDPVQVFDKTFPVPGPDTANQPPVAGNGSVQTDEDTGLPIVLIASDPDNDPLTYTIVSAPASGSLGGTAPNLTYTPAANFNGTDSFTFKVSDGPADSTVATVSITVNAVNDPPTAQAQAIGTTEDTAVGVTLTGFDVDFGPLTFAVSTQPAHGTLSGGAPLLTYTPNAGYSGPDSFTFTASDGTATSAPATIAITVSSVNDLPVAAGQSVNTSVNTPLAITLSASDADNDPLTYEIVAPPANGILSGTGPIVTYTPNANYTGPDSFTFKARDGQADSNVATITISVTSTVVTTATSLASSRNPSIAGETVTFTATVTGGTPTGTITFLVDGSPTGSAVPLVGGAAQLTTSQLTAGLHGVTAQYSGDANHTASASPALSQRVDKAVTTTTLVAEPSPSQPNAVVVLTATITGFSPGGLVTFTDGNQVVGTATAVNGVATLATNQLKKGKRQLGATYAGDGNNLGSTSPKIRLTVK